MIFRNRYIVLLLAFALFLGISGCRKERSPGILSDRYAVSVDALLPEGEASAFGSRGAVTTTTPAQVAFVAGSQVGIYVISRTATNVARTLIPVKPNPADETDVDVYNSNYYADGSGTLMRVPLEFYPSFEEDQDKPRQVDIYGYHPYDEAIGTSPKTSMTAYPFEVRASQVDATDFLESDFMWARNIYGKESEGVVPSATAVPMVFAHKMSRVDVWLTLPLITTIGKTIDVNVPPSGVEFHSVHRGSTVNLSTGVSTLSTAPATRSNVEPNVVAVIEGESAPAPGGAPYKYSFIAPAQAYTAGSSFFSCVITYTDGTMGSINYRVNASMFDTYGLTTQKGKYHRLNLTLLGPIELTLTGSTITDWTPGAVTAADLSSKVTTRFSATTLGGTAVPDNGIDSVKMTTDEGIFVITSGVTFDRTSGVCTFEFVDNKSPRDYGFRITKLEFYRGETVVISSADYTSPRVYDPVSMDLGSVILSILIDGKHWAIGNLVADGANGCKIGAPTDGGLYFRWGKLVGWSGGSTGDGTGVLDPDPEGKPISPTLSVRVKPVGYTSSTSWSVVADIQGSYASDTPATGVGDPCRYYLGTPWHTPTKEQYATLTGATTGETWTKWNVSGVKGKWDVGGDNGGWFGAGLSSGGGAIDQSKQIFFPASGVRRANQVGTFGGVGAYGCYWSRSAYPDRVGSALVINEGAGVIPQEDSPQLNGFSIRCVKE